MLNIVIPMAGAGSRFTNAGYKKSKPFIDVYGKPMIECVLDNLYIENARFILILRLEHLEVEKENIERLKQQYNCTFITVDKLTEGAACTILLACEHINTDDALLLANSDQIVEMNISDYVNDSQQRDLDGSILTFYSDHPKWSYAKLDDNGMVTEVKEKQPISKHATVGLYYFEKGKDFVNSAVKMIANNDRVNNEFYTAPAYNYAISNEKKIGIYEIKEAQMFGLGTPEDLDGYIKHLEKNGYVK